MFQRSLQWVSVVFGLILGAPAVAQNGGCAPTWLPDLNPPGPGFTIKAVTQFNDGKGQKIVAAGESAGGAVAAWDGTKWTSLGDGVTDGVIRTLAVFDDGNGPALYAGGTFKTIKGVSAPKSLARWDGSQWTAIQGPWGTGDVNALCVYTDANGTALFAAGQLYWDGANHIARFDALGWTATSGSPDDTVYALAEFEDQDGAALYVGGQFDYVDGKPCHAIAKWDGVNWSPLGNGIGWQNPGDQYGIVRAMCVTTVSGQPALAVGGDFLWAGGVQAYGVALWDGAGWTSSGSNFPYEPVQALQEFAEGQTRFLYAGGYFSRYGLPTGLMRWDGATWSQFGMSGGANGYVYALQTIKDKQGKSLFVGGDFTSVDGILTNKAARIAKDQVQAFGQGLDGPVRASILFDDGSGAKQYIGGSFAHAGGVPANGVARWNGWAWEAMDGGLGTVNCFAVYDAGEGPELYAGGQIYVPDKGHFGIARWDGAKWNYLGSGVHGIVEAMAVHDDGSGPALYVGGSFGDAGYITFTTYIARWDGGDWSPLADGMDGPVYALTVYDSGTGPRLLAGGAFQHGGQTLANRVASWDGAKWSKLAGGVDNEVRALAVFNEEEGPRLFAGGSFMYANFNVMCNRLARWNGSAWGPVGNWTYGGQGDVVNSMVVHDDGTGPALYLGGVFEKILKDPMHGLARWDGSGFTALPQVVSSIVGGISSVPDGDANSLWVGGSVTLSDNNSPSPFRVLVGCPTAPCYADFTGDGVLDLFDFLGYVNAFNAGEPSADCDKDGGLDLFDFLCFVNAFNQGC